MAFFDRLSEAGHKTIEKTKELADITRLNSQISKEEREIDQQCYEIGVKYLENHRDSYEDDYAPMMESIFKSEKNIEDFRQQIQDIKAHRNEPENEGAESMKQQAGSATCPHCGAPVDGRANFCPSCGKPLNVVSEAVHDMQDTEPGDTQEAEPEPETEAEPERDTSPVADDGVKVCPNCGAQMPSDRIFCDKCGARL